MAEKATNCEVCHERFDKPRPKMNAQIGDVCSQDCARIRYLAMWIGAALLNVWKERKV